jgi:hypothetical protein
MVKSLKHIILIQLLIIFMVASITFVRSADIHASIYFDIFTQKEPYNGRGLNQSSDMFGPQEIVEIYAMLEKNGFPLSGKLVTFEIRGPINYTRERDIEFYMVAETNSSGIAKVSFSLAVINQTSSFGTWMVIGKTEVDGKFYSDVLTFHVGWIIELLYMRTIDGKLNDQISFGIGGDVGFEMVFRNNALTPKNVSIAVTIFDELMVPVNSLYLKNLLAPPNGKIQRIYQKLSIPKFAVPGKAKIIAVALDEDDVPYCPETSQDFWISTDNPISIEFIDASIVYVTIFPQKLYIGDLATITVLIRNEGTVLLSNFYVSVYANDSFIYSKFVSKLAPSDTLTIQASWDTSNFSAGKYAVTISLPYFMNEAEISDNIYVEVIELNERKPVFLHDIQILRVNFSKNEVFQGDIIDVGVTIQNNGNITESTSIKIYLNNSQIQEIFVYALEPSTVKYLHFQWNTTFAPIGEYRILAVASPVEGETNIENNFCYSDIIKIKAKQPQIIHDVSILYLSALPSVVFIGEPINITVKVANFGNIPETFNVTLYYDSFPLDILKVGFLAPGANVTLFYVWDTSNVLEGNYTIKAVVPPLAGEENLANNQFVDGKVWVRAPQAPVKKHDVAVNSLSISKSQVFRGEDLMVYVNVANVGDYDEIFRLTVYANMSTVWACQVDLKAGDSKLLSFTWRVNLGVGRYVVWAKAENVTGETNIENNIFVDGALLVLTPPIHYFHDVAVTSLYPSSHIAYAGQELNITVTVKNLGNATESFNLTLYYDSNVIGRVLVRDLPPWVERSVTFEWDTSNVAEGNYTLKAYAEPVKDETNTANNLFIDGKVAVLKAPPIITHDVAVLWLGPEKYEINVGEALLLKVVVANFGNIYEKFNVTVSYDSRTISTISVGPLAPYKTREITICWNTSNVKPGAYILSASIPPVEGETDTANNVFVDGKVTLKTVFAVSLFLLILPFIIGLAAFLIIILLYYLRKRRKATKPMVSQYVLLGKLGV